MATHTIDDISKAKYHNRKIKLRCVVAGKSISPYRIPKKIRITPVIKNDVLGHPTEHAVVANNDNILRFIDLNKTMMKSVIRDILNITDKNFQYDILETQTVDRIFFHSIAGENRARAQQTTMGYVFENSLDINCLYQLSGYSTVDPNNQQVTCVFTKAKKLRSDLEAFNAKERWDNLEAFRIKNPTVEKVMGLIIGTMNSYAFNVTKIHGRPDLHLAVDLVFHSALEFYLGEEYVKKGWLDCMILGDTRCGKGFVVERLVEYFGVGEVVSAENSSYAGIVAGLEQYNKSWTVRWGKIPMNDRGLCAIDESSNLGADVWSRLSRIRSEGLAEINKIHTHQTNARTRLIFISNPIKSTISAHTHGIEALQEIIESPEDIARFDFVAIVASDEVSLRSINQHRDRVTEVFTQRDERDLIMWIWSRTANQIVFTDTAQEEIYASSIKLGRIYDSRIPLIQGENIRIKLARLAVAFAARCYNAINDGTTLEVTAVFVQCAVEFLSSIYEKKSNGYYDYSMNKQTKKGIEKDLATVEEYLRSWPKKHDMIVMYFHDNAYLVPRSMQESLDMEQAFIQQIISKLVNYRMIELVSTKGYRKTPHFSQWVKAKYRFVVDQYRERGNA